MIAVGVLGFPFIGFLQDKTASTELTANAPAIANIVLEKKEYFGREYSAINPEQEKVAVAQQGEGATAALEASNTA